MATYILSLTLLIQSTYCTPLTATEQKHILNVHNGGYVSSAPSHPTTSNMNHLIWTQNYAKKTEGYDSRAAIGDFKNYDMHWIIFVSIILVILFMKSGCSIEFICFLVLFYVVQKTMAIDSDCGLGGCTEFTNAEKQQILDIHNELRDRVAGGGLALEGHPAATDMNYLIWDEGLANMAQTYAEQCTWAHNLNRETEYAAQRDLGNTHWTPTLTPSPTNISNGEILGAISSIYDMDAILAAIESNWFNEYKIWTFGTVPGTCTPDSEHSVCEHYTQLVWGNTRYVGCGYVNNCINPTNLPWSTNSGSIFVCNYFPAANYNGYKPYTNTSTTSNICTECETDRLLCKSEYTSHSVNAGSYPAQPYHDLCDGGVCSTMCNSNSNGIVGCNECTSAFTPTCNNGLEINLCNTLAPSPPTSQTSTVVIGAIIAGCVVGILLLAGIIHFAHKHMKNKKVQEMKHDVDNSIINSDQEQPDAKVLEKTIECVVVVNDTNDSNEVESKDGETVVVKHQHPKMKAFMGELEELIGIIQRHLDFMDKQDCVVEEVINKSNEKNRLQSAKKVALTNEKELLEEIMNYNEMNSFLNNIILIENMFNHLYAPKKSEQQNARNKYAQNIEIYESKQKPISDVPSFVDLLFEGTMLGMSEFKKWLKKIEVECKKQGITIIENSGAKAKNIERAFYKAFYVYSVNDTDNGFKQMTDVLRCSLVFDHFDHLYQCFTVIEQLSKENNNGGILRCKDRFNPENVPFGYRDLLINIYCPQSKIVCEIQLHYVLFYKQKKISHTMYKKARLFEDTESGQNLAYRYADKNNRKHIGDKIYQLQNDGKNNEAYKLLEQWNLSIYAPVLIEEEGYDDIEHWEELTVSRLKEMGFKEGHAKKFVKKCAGITIK